jgi:hypothetical protein
MQDALDVQYDPGGPAHTPLMRALEEAQEVQVPASLLQPPQALSTVVAQHRPARHLLDAQSCEMATTTAKKRSSSNNNNIKGGRTPPHGPGTSNNNGSQVESNS